MRTLLFLAAATALHANSFSSVSITAGDCPTQSVQSATGAVVSAESACFSARIGGIGASGSVSAGGSYVTIDMHTVSPPIDIFADGRSTSTAMLPGDGFGMAVMSFQISGLTVKDGWGIGQSFVFSSGSDSEIFAIEPDSCHWCPVSQTVTTQPFRVALGEPFEYTTELIAQLAYRGDGWAIASTRLGVGLLGVEGVGTGQGEEVPEPGSFILLASALAALMLLRRHRQRSRRTASGE